MPSFDESVKSSVSGVLQDTKNVTAKVAQATPKVAPSIFETGPKDIAIAVDRFGKREIAYVNQQAAGIKGAFDSFFANNKVIALTKGVLSDIAKTTNAALTAVTESKKALENYTGLNLSSVGAAKASLMQASITTMSNVTGMDMQKVMRDSEDIQRIAAGADIGDVNSLFNTANRLLGTNTVGTLFDTRTESSVFGSIMQQASELGMVDMFDTLWDKVKKNDEGYNGNFARYSASNSIPTVLYNGDLVMLNKLIDKLGGDSIIQQYPTAITDFLGNYSLPYDTDPGAYPGIRTEIVNTMTRLDPEWLQLRPEHSGSSRLDPFLKANNVVLAIFTQDSLDTSKIPSATSVAKPEAISALIAGSYPRQSPTSLLRAFYPNIPYA